MQQFINNFFKPGIDLYDIIVVVAIIVAVIIRGLIAIEVDRIAAAKGFPEKRWFWYSFLFGMIGLFLVWALPDKNLRK